MIRFLKNLVWLSKHQKELSKLIEKPKTKSLNDGTFSLAGVPEYQKEYLKDFLTDKN